MPVLQGLWENILLGWGCHIIKTDDYIIKVSNINLTQAVEALLSIVIMG